MSWFDEQIRERKRSDESVVTDSVIKIASAVMGSRSLRATDDLRIQAEGAIVEILRYYRVKGRDLPESVTGIDDIIDYELRPHGIMRRSVSLKKGWSSEASGPMLGQLREGGEVIALIPGIPSGYRYFDPKTGKWVSINKKNEALIAPDAEVFYKPFPKDKKGMACLVSFIIENIDRADIVSYLIFMLIATLIGMSLVDLSEKLMSTVASDTNALISELPGLSRFMFFAAAIYMLSLTVSRILYDTFESLILSRIRLKLSLDVSAAAMMRLLSLPPTFFKKYNSGELSSRMENIDSLMNMLVDAVLTMGVSSIFSLIYIKQIFEFARPLLLPALVTTMATFLLTLLTVSINLKLSRETLLLNSKQNGMTFALISGVRKIKTTGAEKRAFARWANLYSKAAELSFNPPMFIKINGTIIMAIGMAGTFAMYARAVWGGVGISEYYAFNAAYGMMGAAFAQLAGIAVTIANIRPVFEMAQPILDADSEVDEDRPAVERLSGGIELSGVSFSYTSGGPLILDDISLKIKSGQYVAIVGETGCGKSTLMKLLLGFEKPQLGSIYYDGRDLETLDVRSVRQKIGTVMQEGKLFAGDIFSNITISAPLLTLDDAWEAAEMAGMADDIKSMPMGMSTLISEGGGGISGGQKQRLMIARAIAPKPKILMFDEATSALDNITQKKVSESLDALKCTRIVIAHRLSTIRNCDRILVLDKGRIVEDGTFDELMEKDGFFSELVRRQIA